MLVIVVFPCCFSLIACIGYDFEARESCWIIKVQGFHVRLRKSCVCQYVNIRCLMKCPSHFYDWIECWNFVCKLLKHCFVCPHKFMIIGTCSYSFSIMPTMCSMKCFSHAYVEKFWISMNVLSLFSSFMIVLVV